MPSLDLTTFTRMVEELKKNHQQHLQASRLGIDLSEFQSNYDLHVVLPLMHSCFGREGVEWIEWYIYEKCLPASGKPCQAWDKEGNEICRDIPELFNLVIAAGKKRAPKNKKKKPNK
jgi:hypothetical protein